MAVIPAPSAAMTAAAHRIAGEARAVPSARNAVHGAGAKRRHGATTASVLSFIPEALCLHTPTRDGGEGVHPTACVHGCHFFLGSSAGFR